MEASWGDEIEVGINYTVTVVVFSHSLINKHAIQ